MFKNFKKRILNVIELNSDNVFAIKLISFRLIKQKQYVQSNFSQHKFVLFTTIISTILYMIYYKHNLTYIPGHLWQMPLIFSKQFPSLRTHTKMSRAEFSLTNLNSPPTYTHTFWKQHFDNNQSKAMKKKNHPQRV